MGQSGTKQSNQLKFIILYMSHISVLLVDDHNIVRQGLKALLAAEGDITVVAEAQTGREAVQLAAKLHPEVVVMDLAMPLLNGWEATRQILKVAPSAKILVLSTYDSDEHVQQAIAAGAAAYLIKQTAAADLVKAIREAGRIPVQRNTFYEPIKIWDAPAAEDAPEKTESKILEKNLATA